MDDSVRLFNEEQARHTAAGGSASLNRQILSGLVNVIAFNAILGALLAGLDFFPRNPDNSMKLIYWGPILFAVACGAALLLRGHVLDRAHLRPVLWASIVTAVIAVVVGLIDAVVPNGS